MKLPAIGYAEYVNLLGRSAHEVGQSAFVQSFSEVPEVVVIEDSAHWSSPKKSIALHFGAEHKLGSIFFDYSSASNEPATGIPAFATRSEVVALNGVPSKSRGAKVLPVFGKVGAWDRWDHANYSLHVQYATDADGAVLITLMHPSVVPK
jgi:hypothetical protein